MRSSSLIFWSITTRLGRPVSGSVWAPCSSSAWALLFERTAVTTRMVTTADSTSADAKRTMRSVESLGEVAANTMMGSSSEVVVITRRPMESGFGLGWGRPSSWMLGCRNAALATKYAITYIGSAKRSAPALRWRASIIA
ncbi:unannotated protein [freshwater metagenome]|uniref:Unannotated protein n=1 Tax=freshwater metagenome TaxID=449393 RepID=A0A6J7AT52_9ZZZZ